VVFCSKFFWFLSLLAILQIKSRLIKLTCLPCYFQAHPWFEGTEWDKLYQMKAAFIPEVNDELDTQNFEKFEEVD